MNLAKECDSMKKKLPIILLGVILACVLVFGFLYANNDIGKTANSLEADIRQSQKILDDWIVDGSISDTMAAFISYPQDKTDHTFSVYVNRPGLSFGYFFRGGGDIVEVERTLASRLPDRPVKAAPLSPHQSGAADRAHGAARSWPPQSQSCPSRRTGRGTGRVRASAPA